MDQNNSLSRQDIGRLAAVPDDVLSFWLKRGVMPIANPDSGERKHRRFGVGHVQLARFLMVARSAGLNIDTLKALSAEFQEGMATWSSYPAPLEWAGVVLAEAIELMPAKAREKYFANRRMDYVNFEADENDAINSRFQMHVDSGAIGLDYARELRKIANSVSKINIWAWELGWSIAHPAGAMIFAGQVGFGSWVMIRSKQKPRAIASPFAVAFDFEQIFSERGEG